MNKLLGVLLVVKDEAASIEKTVQSLVGQVDALTVMDTGSTDGTGDLVSRKFAGPNGDVDPVLFTEAFTDFASVRNRVVDVAEYRNKTAFMLTLSADETLHFDGDKARVFLEEQRNKPEHGAFCVMVRVGPRQFPSPRILRTGGGWRYVNTAANLHELPRGPRGEIDGPLVPGLIIVHEESNPERKRQRLRERDLPALTAVVEDESVPVEDRVDAMYQLAETHFILGEFDRNETGERERGGRWLSHLFQAMALYTRTAEVVETKGSRVYNAERAVYCQCMYLHVAESFGLFEPSELVKRLSYLAQFAPNLPEAHWMLAKNMAKIDVKKAMSLALKSAKIAHEVYKRPLYGAIDTNIEWYSYLLAAKCAQQIQDETLQRKFASMALGAGAPREKLIDLVGPPS